MVTKTDENLVTKLSRISGSVGSLEKKGFNKFHQYKYVRETDLVDALRPLLAAQSIWLEQNVTSHERIERGDSGLTVIAVEFTWVDGTTGEKLGPDVFIGYGEDKGDKGAAKALTACLKSFLLKTFLVGTGDDPEADENTDKTAEARGAAAAPVIKPGARAAVGKGGKPEQATDAQVREVFHYAKENSLTLTDLAALASRMFDASLDLRGDNPKATFLAFLRGLSAADIGKFILALSTLAPEDEVDILAEGEDAE